MRCQRVSSHVQRRSDGDDDAHSRQTDTGIPTAPELPQQVGAVRVDLLGHRSRDAQAHRNRIVGHGQDERGGDALVLLGHGAAEEDDGGREAHVHAERDDQGRDKGLAPVGLVNRHGGGEDRGDAKGDEGEDHDVWYRHLRYEEARHDRRYESRQGRRRVLCRSHKRRVVPELLQELPEIVQPNAEAGPAGRRGGENEEDWSCQRLHRKQRL